MAMNELLAKHYGTDKLASATEQPAAATVGDLTKEAQVELFVKMAQENGIDLDTLTDAQTAHLFNETFKKEALAPAAQVPAAGSEDPEFQAKLAQADFFGRQMAHAYVAELAEIAQTKTAAAATKVASALKTAEEKEKEEKEKKDKEEGDKDEGKGETKLPPWMMDKKASAEVLAGQIAVQHIVDFNKTAAPDARYNEWQAVDRIGAVLTLGAPTEKTATVVDAAQRLQVQALEILEAAGYPVTWTK